LSRRSKLTFVYPQRFSHFQQIIAAANFAKLWD
jgi:hypothetical protein